MTEFSHALLVIIVLFSFLFLNPPISSFSSWLGNGRVSRVWGNPEKFSAGRLGLSRMSMSSKDPQIPSPSGAKELRSVGSRPPASQAHLPVLYCFPGRNHTFLFKGRR